MSGGPVTIPVSSPASPSGSYPVMVGTGLLARLPALLREHAPASRYAVLSDDTVARLHGTGLVEALVERRVRADLFTFPPGESRKVRATWEELTDRLLEAGLDRNGAIVAVGGGVVGDLAGFVAATFMRGLPVVQVPTSLVAMVDSSVGGKTGVDVPAGKNLVGAFHPPLLVVADPATARTLPRSERAQGLAEAVKHAAIRDRGHLGALVADAGGLLDGDPEATARAVVHSVRIKAEVVGRDEREGGLRRILNFGHTLGHALEAAAGWGVPHGSAVSIGMVLEARLGETMQVTAPGTADALARALAALELPVELPRGVGRDRILSFTRTDKKGVEGRARYVLLRRLGEVDPGAGWVHEVPEEVVRKVLEPPAEPV